jgi:glycosidase
MSNTKVAFEHVDWSKNAIIYEVNIRQYTPEGTFSAFQKHLPRLKKMGVNILWLMPINPIGNINHKGTLGSYYAVRDYFAVNAEFGTLNDFKNLVRAVHDSGMYLIIDWVPNHTAWDNPWVTAHPEWYKKNAKGEIHSLEHDNGKDPIEYWTDVVGLDYQQSGLWSAMTEVLEYWIRETDIDGYRCDVAGLLPTPFWEHVRASVDKIKPVFMLAEWSDPGLHHKAFDMTYDWDLYDTIILIAKGKATVHDLISYLAVQKETFPRDAYRMLFTSNHDKNSWMGSDAEMFGTSFKLFTVLAFTLPGMPLIYGGQESWLDKRLEFFEKDQIDWNNYPLENFYIELVELKSNNPALWNGTSGGEITILPICTSAIFAFGRNKEGNSVSVIANLSSQSQNVTIPASGNSVVLEAWSYLIHTYDF